MEIDATGGIVMPGMIDTHRHMWQTAMRGYGADWTLTQYFVWYYLEHGKVVPPAGHPRGQPARGDRGARRRRHDHRRLVARPADRRARRRRGRRAASRCRAGSCWPTATSSSRPREWIGSPEFRDFVQPAHHRRRHARLPAGVRRHRRPGVPGEAGVRGRARARRPGHHARRRVGRDERRRHPAHARQRLHDRPATIYVHAATLSADSYHRIAATGGSVSVSTESEQSAGQGYPPTWAIRAHGIPVSLSMDTSVWWSGDLFSAMRTTLGADRSREHLEAHAKGEHRHALRACAPTRSSSGRPAAAPRRWAGRDVGSLEVGKKADVVLIKNEQLAGVVPGAQPVRPRGVPGPARRRAHRARQRPRREARRTAWSTSTWPRPAARSRRPSSTCGPRSASEAWQQGHEPGHPGDQGPRQPVHLHRLPERRHPQYHARRGLTAVATNGRLIPR